MDLFRFENPDGPEYIFGGQFINDFKSATWIERYRDAGEFTIVADESSNLPDLIPRGAFISHTDSREIMVVENIEKTAQDNDEEATVTITGRSFETYLENRVVGGNLPDPTDNTVDYPLLAGYAWFQVVDLIQDHIYPDRLLDPGDGLPNVAVGSEVSWYLPTDIGEMRRIPKDDLYKVVLEVLAICDLGLCSYRPCPWGPTGSQDGIRISVNRGEDVSAYVTLSYQDDELVSSDALWSIKTLKNAAVITSKWFTTRVTGPETGHDRRIMYIPFPEIDEAWETAPTGGSKDAIIAAMKAKGQAVLAKQKAVDLTKVEVNPQLITAIYGQHYKVGDIITVVGKDGIREKMRVTEYVNIQDENGETGYPTLSNTPEVAT